MRDEERRQRPTLMVLNTEQWIAKDHPLRRIKQAADTVLKHLSPAFAQIYSTMWLPRIPPERPEPTPFRLTVLGRALARCDRIASDEVGYVLLA